MSSSEQLTVQQALSGIATAERLAERFAETFETQEADEDVFAPEVFFDLNMPVWRFQLQGPAAFSSQLKSIVEGEVRIEILRTVPTITGFVTEHLEHQHVDGRELTARRLWLCDVRAGRIVEAVCYCSGEWDDELRARHAAEAPMIRP
jgi:anti-sigma factor ChrR (cupin superfamily)